MNKKFGLSHVTMMITLGIILVFASAYVPMLGILSFVVPVPFAIIGTLCKKKYALLSLIAAFFIIMFCIDPIYSVSTCVLSIIPGLVIGIVAKNNINEDGNKFEPIYGGTIAYILCTILFYFIARGIFKVDLISEFTQTVSAIFKEQQNIMNQMNVDLYKNINIEDILSLMKNMIPTMLFLQGIVASFITYYIEVFILKRIKVLSLPKPAFREFHLPGNAVGTSLLLYILVILLGFMKIGLYTDSILFNLQMVFDFMFIIQGIAVAIYYAQKWIKQGTGKNILVSGLLLSIFGTMGVSFLGMLDSIIDFRRVRSHKSA